MATQTETRTQRGRRKKAYAEFDEYIRFQLQKTRQGIRSTDIFTAACGVAVAVVTYLLVFVVLDHWVVPGGFGYLWRVGLLSFLLIGSLAWIGWKVVLPWLKNINRLYAAKAIEVASPELNSTLLNYVDLKAANREVAPEILTSLEKQAAVTLSHIHVDEAIDRRPLLRLCYALLVVVVAFCLYTVFSPKKVGPSIWRALIPASSVQVATQTQFLSIEPGDTEAFARQIVEVTVDLTGEIPKEITLYFSTDDRSFVKEPVPMRQTADGLKQYRCVLNGQNGEGLLQGVDYWIEAGDAKSDVFHITVNQPPSVSVGSVHYDFPPYTQLNSQTSDGGAIETLEGTKVRIEAAANMPVSLAKIQFSDSELFEGKSEEAPVRLSADGRKVTFEFQPQLREKNSFPKFYRIWCKTDSGATDPSPTVHPIAITPDREPELTLVAPTAERTVAANAIVPMLVRSHDPDFRLSQVKLILKRDTETLPFQIIYEGTERGIERLHELKLEELQVRPGDTITYWIEAQDNRYVDFAQTGIQLGANRVRTVEQQLIIEEPVTPEEAKQEAEAEKERIKDQLEAQENAANQDDAGTAKSDGTDEEKPKEAGSEQPREEGTDPESRPKAGEEGGEKSEGGENSQGAESGEKPGEGEPGSESTTKPGEKPGTGESGEKTGSEGTEKGDEGAGGAEQGAQQDRKLSSDGRDDAEALRQILKQEQDRQKQAEAGESKPGENDPSKPGQGGGEKPDGSGRTPDSKPDGTVPPDRAPGQPGEKSEPDSTKPGTEPKPGESGSKPKENPNDTKPGENGENTPQNLDNSNSKPNDAGPPEKPGESDPRNPNGTNAPESKPGEGTTPEQKPGENPGSPDSKPGESGTSKPGESGSPKPGENGSPKPGENGSPKPGESGSPKPGESGSPKPGESGSPKPGESGSPKPGESGSPKPGESGSPKPGESGSPKPGESGSSKTGEKPKPGEAGGKPKSEGEPGEGGEPDNKPGEGGGKPGESGNKPGENGESGDKPGEGEGGGPGQPATGPSNGEATSGKGRPTTHSGPASQAADPKSGKPNFDPENIGEQPGNNAQQAQHSGGQAVDSNNPEAEAANLEDRKKATNLVLKKLKDQIQRGEVDDEMLQKLGWTKDDMQKFVERMEAQQKAAESNDAASQARKRQYEEMLRSLNLDHQGGERADTVKQKQDTTDFLDRRSRVPAEYRKAAEEYTKRMSRKKSASR